MKIVFIGDSITEWGRHECSEGIGTGYVRLIYDYLKVVYPQIHFEIVNTGVGGNRITDLEQRWDEDVIQHKPDIVSISIGVNDVWRQFDHSNVEQVSPQAFERIYIDLLSQVKKSKIVLMEPTIIEENLDAEGNKRLKDYVEIIHKVARKFDATVIPTHQACINYLKINNGYKLTTDGVHMNSAGNMLMAVTWLENAHLQS